MKRKRPSSSGIKNVCIIVLAVIVVICMFQGCGNKQIIDTTYTFDKAIISLPNGEVVEGKVKSWSDYEDGDQIQVKIGDKTYLVHSSNIALIAE